MSNTTTTTINRVNGTATVAPPAASAAKVFDRAAFIGGLRDTSSKLTINVKSQGIKVTLEGDLDTKDKAGLIQAAKDNASAKVTVTEKDYATVGTTTATRTVSGLATGAAVAEMFELCIKAS